MAINLVQFTSGATSSGGTLSLTPFSTATTPGNCVIICAGTYDTSAAAAISACTLGGAAGNFASLISAVNASSVNGYQTSAIWADPNCGSSTAVAVTSISSVDLSATAFEFSGLLATSTASALVDKSTSGSNPSSTNWAAGTTGTTTSANELWVGVSSTYNQPLTGPGGSWTTEQPSGDVVLLMPGYQIVTTTGTVSYAGTQSPADPWSACAVALFGAAPITTSGLLMLFP